MKPIENLAGALAAIDMIVEQGEGSPAEREESHYRSFLGLRAELEDLVGQDAGFVPAWPVADNPVLRQPPEPEDKVFINHPEAAALLDFTCATYGLLLRCLVQCFGRQEVGAASTQKALMMAAIELMHVLGQAATDLARLPATIEGDGANAGMTFTMLRGVEPLLFGPTEKLLLVERVQSLASAGKEYGPNIRQPLGHACESLRGLPE